MLFKAKKSVEPAEQSRDVVLAHLDSPTSYPRATLFKVSGWLSSDEEVSSIRIGSELMSISERADVRAAHPEYKFAVGFSGLARESELQGQHVEINVATSGDDYQRLVGLAPDVMLSLSKHEKLAKFASAFPNDDAATAIEDSRNCEVSNDDLTKFEHLKSIVKCSICGAIGLSLKDETLSCTNCHPVETIGNAYIYLNETMRAEHNIKPNIEPASRAQDPLAVALIGKFSEGLILDCGSGLPFQNYSNVINFDIEKFSNTDVIGVGEELPFADNSFNAVFSFSVLEHVKDPFRCAAEIERVLKSNGIIYSSVPFLIPVHGYPHHYYNMTQLGMENLFSNDIDVLQTGVPSSGHPLFTLNSVANIWHSALSDEEREAFKNLTLAEIMDDPAKLIDKGFCNNLPQATQSLISCTNMLLGKKRS